METVKCLCLNRSKGPLEMRADNFHQWLQEAMRENDPDFTNWEKLVVLVQA